MRNSKSRRPIDIPLVEDNPGDVRLTSEALDEVKVPKKLHLAREGVEAMSFVRQEGPYAGAARPDLILLDLNLPAKSGREVLAETKSDQDLRQIPVVVLTSSKAEQDIATTYRLPANCYIAKPMNLDQYLDVIRSTESFWLTVVELPTVRGK